MAIIWVGKDIEFSSADFASLPTNVPVETKATEINSDDIYRFNGTAWVLYIANNKTETLTNKSISGATNTLSAIPVNSLSNFAISSPMTNHVIQYNGTNWVNATAGGGAGGGAEGAYKYIVFLDGSTYYCQDAKGNTVSSNAAPVTVIQYALDNLSAGRTWKQTVKLKGTFTFPQITLSSFTILDLTEAEINQSNGTNANFISNADKTSGNTNIEIVGGVIDGNKSGQSAGGTEDNDSMIYFKKCSSVSIHHALVKNGDFHNVRFRDCPSHIEFCNNRSLDPRHEHIACHAQGTTPGSCKNYVIANNRFQNISEGQSYITTIAVADCIIANNTCSGMFGNTSSFALNGLRQVVVGNTISDVDGPGINLGQLSSADYDTSGSIVIGNSLKNIQRYAIESQGRICSNLVVANNIVDGVSEAGHRGIYMIGLLDSVISNNIIKNIASSGIVVRGSGTVSLPTRRVKIIGNIVYNSGQALDASDSNRCGITVFGGVAADATYIDVENNKCYDLQGTKSQKWGIRFNLTENCICRNNDVRNNLTAGIQDTSNTTFIIGGNLGFLTANADTSGAALAALETEVNQLKATLRENGIIA